MTNQAYPVFSIDNRSVSKGASPQWLTLSNGQKIPALIVGDEGRGRTRGVVPLDRMPMAPCKWWGEEIPTYMFNKICGVCGEPLSPPDVNGLCFHPEAGHAPGQLFAASLTTTRAGRPKFRVEMKPNTDEAAILVVNSTIGYRGSNTHTGDDDGWKCLHCNQRWAENPPEQCPECRATPYKQFKPVPGKILATGRIAQGAAGRMGSGEQHILLIPKDEVLRVAMSGRLYGQPSEYFYVFDGQQVIKATREERELADLF